MKSRMMPVRDLCSLVTSGGTPRRSVSAYFDPPSVAWVKTGDLTDGPVERVDEFISELGLAESSAKLLPSHSVLVAMYGATVGAMGWLREPMACNQAACALVADPERCDWRWLFYSLMASRADLVGFANGAAQQNLNVGHVGSFVLQAPSLPTQRAIAEVLGTLDDKIAANQRVADSADRLAAALLARETSESTELAEVAEIVMGSSPRGDSMNEEGHGIEFFQGVRDFGMRVPTPRVSTTEPTKIARAGDVLLSVRAPVGRVNRADRAVCIGRGLAAIRCAMPNVLFHTLRSASVWDSFNGEGTVFGSISGKDLHGVRLLWPSGARATYVEQALQPIESRIDQAMAESAQLAALRDTLLPHLMSGRLTVREAEQQVEEVL